MKRCKYCGAKPYKRESNAWAIVILVCIAIAWIGKDIFALGVIALGTLLIAYIMNNSQRSDRK